MPPFRPDEFGRIDYQLMQNSPVALYHSPAILGEHAAELEALGYRCPALEARGWDTEERLHDDFARVLDFPDYYGRNLDALNDCLWDLPYDGRTGIGLVITGYDTFAARFPRVAWDVLDIIGHNSRDALLVGNRLLALVQSDDPRLHFEPVGGTAPTWNFREWFDRDRGL
jgi:hypothetical protein